MCKSRSRSLGRQTDPKPPGTTTAEMTKKDIGVWTVMLGPFEPNLYEYCFKVDDLRIADPENAPPDPGWKVTTRLPLGMDA